MTNPNTAPSAAQPYAIDGVVYAIARKDQREAYVMFDTPAQANGFVEYMRRFIEKPEVASRDAGGAASGGQGEPQKYDDVLVPFVAAMRKELHANTRKGDRPGWLTMDANTALLEVYWHAAKLSAAVKNNDGPAIQEHSADVANMAMMVLDICGGLAWVDVSQEADARANALEQAATLVELEHAADATQGRRLAQIAQHIRDLKNRKPL